MFIKFVKFVKFIKFIKFIKWQVFLEFSINHKP